MGLAAAALVGALTLAACGSSDSGSSSGGSGGSAAPSSDMKVGLAYDIGGRGDKSFNDSAAVGLDAFKTKNGLPDSNVKELSARAGETDTDRATRLELLAKTGFNPIVAVGFAYAPALKTVAPKYPDVKFGIIDATPDDVKAPNVSNLTFAEEQGISKNNATVRVFRAREALRRQVAVSCGTCAEHGCLSCTCQSTDPVVKKSGCGH